MLLLVLVASTSRVSAQTPKVDSSDVETMIVEGSSDTQVFAFGKNVIVRAAAREVLVFGGNVTIEGRVDGDVGAVGGSVIQSETGYIGGDVIVLGGNYSPSAAKPLRAEGRETVIIGVFEEELRDFARNPAAILSPSLSWSFFAQRLLSVLFWFLVSFGIATISPGAIGRSVARLQLSTLKVIAFGLTGFVATIFVVIASVGAMPGYLGGIVGLMALVLLFFAYVFGRVTLQVGTGKLLQKRFVPERFHSETLAMLLGVSAWTAILSIPYVWTAALVLLFAASIGLVLTASQKRTWQTS